LLLHSFIMCEYNSPRTMFNSASKSQSICRCNLLATYISVQSYLVATPNPDRPLFRQTHINDSQNASSFSELRFTGDGSNILMQFVHEDGRSGVFTLDSSAFDELIVNWNDTVTVALEGFAKQ
ncbi:hypothetical protein PENTCL1PPCAC_18511, partial [Pristionchus entomophagus]